MADYQYNESAFVGLTASRINLTCLTAEIQNSAISPEVLQGIVRDSGVVTITFDVALDAGDVTILDGLVAAHTGETCDDQADVYFPCCIEVENNATIGGDIIITGYVDGVDVGNPKNSIEVDANQYQLVGDQLSPGNDKRYGTNEFGVKGWYDAFGVEEDLAGVQRRATVSSPCGTSWSDISLPTVDVENDPTIVEADDTYDDRVKVYETGLYLISYAVRVAFNSEHDHVYFRVRANDTTVLSGSEETLESHWSNGDDDIQGQELTARPFIASLNANDFVSLQCDADTTGDTLLPGTILVVTRLKGPRGAAGDDGAPGSGAQIIIKDEGTNIPNTPHSALNFVGADFTVTDGGGGVAVITHAATWGNITGTLSNQTDLQTALDLKANAAITITGATSLTGGGDLSANRTLTLVNDAATPGNDYFYGTNEAGVKGWYSTSTVGGGALGLGEWEYETGILPPPSDKKFKFNNADPSLATKLYIDYTNDEGDDLTNFLKNVGNGSVIYAQDREDSTKGFVCNVTAYTDQTTYAEYDITDVTLLGLSLPTGDKYKVIAVGSGGVETDPVFVASAAYGITGTDITNWNTAYGWGNHASAGYITGVAWGDITGTLSNQTDLQSALDGKEPTFTKNTAFNKDFGSIAGTVCEGNDARLSDARTPTAHATTHESGGSDTINHDNLVGFVAAEHINWSVTGAEDINVDRITAGAVTQHEGSINHDNLLGFVANEHATPKNSIEIDTGKLQLVNDAASPGNNYVYGTNASGVKGWKPDPAGGGVFGDEYDYTTASSQSSTSSSSYQNKLNWTTGTLPAGTYHIRTSGQVRNESSKTSRVRTEVAGTVVREDTPSEYSDPWYFEFNHHHVYVLASSGTINIQVDYSTTSDGGTAYIRNVLAEIWRVE